VLMMKAMTTYPDATFLGEIPTTATLKRNSVSREE
jgi:hypothetical protein